MRTKRLGLLPSSRSFWTVGPSQPIKGYDCVEESVSTKSNLILTCRSPMYSETQMISPDVIAKRVTFRKIDYMLVFDFALPMVGWYYDKSASMD